MSDFTDREQAHVRAALNFIRARSGTWDVTAKALRFAAVSLRNVAAGRKPATPALAVRIAKLANVGVDEVLTGRFPAPGTCPHCGRPPGASED